MDSETRIVATRSGKNFWVSAEDYNRVLEHGATSGWFAKKVGGKERIWDGNGQSIGRFILYVDGGRRVYHLDGNTFNAVRSNLSISPRGLVHPGQTFKSVKVDRRRLEDILHEGMTLHNQMLSEIYGRRAAGLLEELNRLRSLLEPIVAESGGKFVQRTMEDFDEGESPEELHQRFYTWLVQTFMDNKDEFVQQAGEPAW